jgi:hypothetical protein
MLCNEYGMTPHRRLLAIILRKSRPNPEVYKLKRVVSKLILRLRLQPIETFINTSQDVNSWKALDVYGHFIAEEVVAGCNSCNTFVADISVLNFNVTYEIGYAIGKRKRVLLTKNSSKRNDQHWCSP